MPNRMKSPIFSPFFSISVFLYLIVRISRYGFFDLPVFINSYLTDFLCMPIILTLSLVGVRWIKKIPEFILSPVMIFGMTGFYALLFEVILPQYSSKYTQDPIDFILYFCGALLYWFLNRK